MGASKKLMEETIMGYSRDLKITTARFANVAFSNGFARSEIIKTWHRHNSASKPTKNMKLDNSNPCGSQNRTRLVLKPQSFKSMCIIWARGERLNVAGKHA